MFKDDEIEFEDDEFQWDIKKAAENFRKHGICFEDARKVFDDNRYINVPDTRKNYGEDRFQAIGKVQEDYYTVVYTIRDDKRRLISAWKSEGDEKSKYANSPGSDLSHEELRRFMHNIKRKKGKPRKRGRSFWLLL